MFLWPKVPWVETRLGYRELHVLTVMGGLDVMALPWQDRFAIVCI